MGNKILAVMVGGLLILPLFPAVPARAQPEVVQAEEGGEKDAGWEVPFIIDAVERAAGLEILDMESREIADFLAASEVYDRLDEETRSSIPSQTTADLEAVQGRIGEVIHTCEGVTASSKKWYVGTNVTDGEDPEMILELLENTYKGSSPQLIYYKNISYTDIRSKEEYLQDSMISVTFPIPENYECLINPHIFTIFRGRLMELMPEKNGEGNFYLGSARTLSSIIIVDLPMSLSGITMAEEAGINVGQTYELKVQAVPADTTEVYTLVWESSNPNVAQVDAKGAVTGIAPGTAWITAAADGREEVKAVCRVTVVQGAHSLGTAVWEALEDTRAYIRSVDQVPAIGSEWNVIGLARGGTALEDSYFSVYYNHFANYLEEKKGKLTSSIKYTEYSKAIITMTAMGKDARNVGGYNLLENLADFDNVIAQGINGPIWALIALDSNSQYVIPEVEGIENQTTREKLLAYILKNKTPSGGWDLLGLAPDPDMTGMAIQALAPYYRKNGYEDVTAAVDEGLEALSRIQGSDGSYSTMGAKTLESCAQVVTALCALGIDPETDARFIKGGYWTVENLLSYHIPGSGFMHVKAGEGNNGGGTAGEINGMATEQGHYALVAYQRFKQGKTSLYDMSDLEVAEGGKGDGQGTGLEEPSSILKEEPSSTPGPVSKSDLDVSGGNGNYVVEPNADIGSAGSTGSTISVGNAGRQASAGNVSPAPVSAPKNTSTGQVSENKQSSGKAQKEIEEDGWNFEAESYEEIEDGWDFQGESQDAGNQEAEVWVEEEETEEKKKQIPPLASGIAGGVMGAAALEGCRFLWKRKKSVKEI